ncbi:hypothetical protein [Mesorhizobium sp. M6A.T.Ce.TU.016.01.1.1]|uniref:hypothetical protein n=1 Tax=Mesorhizobium sp. M6A.T.Ce.TU.016.01.1.1 TaxID=2496783 RepID=UPI000FCAB6ED|nr:hypothetical protein [Mesorhizobium sp. M6A.T.Ce.TU.016.01.1.1]RUU25282.1 hypothetical protein EOC94_32160 [Mesorhizobium sp. M6A.T.Ce.TU.016.01.1.1]
MTTLLPHDHGSGIYSSRRIADPAVERADFMMMVAGDPPEFPQAPAERADYSVRAGVAAGRKAGLVMLGHVALDGTKTRTNASKHKR